MSPVNLMMTSQNVFSDLQRIVSRLQRKDKDPTMSEEIHPQQSILADGHLVAEQSTESLITLSYREAVDK